MLSKNHFKFGIIFLKIQKFHKKLAENQAKNNFSKTFGRKLSGNLKILRKLWNKLYCKNFERNRMKSKVLKTLFPLQEIYKACTKSSGSNVAVRDR